MIKSAANTSVLPVLSKLALSKLFLPHARESSLAGLLPNALVLTDKLRNRLIRFMFGHLLLLSSASDIARRRPRNEPLILRGLEQRRTPPIVVTRTRCGSPDTERQGETKDSYQGMPSGIPFRARII